MRKTRYLLLGSFLVIGLIGCGSAADSLVKADSPAAGTPASTGTSTPGSAIISAKPEIGRAAPEFKLTGLDGKIITNADFKGKVVLLDFWASWDKNSSEVKPMVEGMIAKFKAKGLEVVSINSLEKLGLDPAKLKDTNLKKLSQTESKKLSLANSKMAIEGDSLIESWGFKSVPLLVVIDREGNVVAIENSSAKAALINIETKVAEAVK